ncbi:MAG: NAD(P)/FAD-dependent oxidoreductase [Ectothiorhodospiraceae bacterium]|nr:NAD(P)/FAD-dependent oxidoreductase [Chromatiales bacterium]MCP5154388.1 NAD(P)/FAD-dependent oxidoreductase [Ectothiorhodospiraceae bacterium]
MANSTPVTHDVAVVGGSFAGLTVARTAAARGLRVVVVDRRFDPGTQLHTTGLLVKEAAEMLDLPPGITRKVPRVRLYPPVGAAIDLASPGYYFLATDTPSLMRWLAGRAREAGAELRYASRFTGATRTHDAVVLHGLGISARYLVGADGAGSRVARVFGLGRNRRFLGGIEAELPATPELDQGALHVLVDPVLAPGYIAWAVPGAGITQVGIACSHPRRPDLQAVLERLAPVVDLRRVRPLAWRAGRIPVGGPVRPFAAPGVLLVGDAAGHVSPLTGGGIANALHLGRRAGHLIADFLDDGGPEPSLVLARERPSYLGKRLLRALADLPAPAWVVDGALRTGWAQAIARQVFFHARGPVSRVGRAPHFVPVSRRGAWPTSGLPEA